MRNCRRATNSGKGDKRRTSLWTCSRLRKVLPQRAGVASGLCLSAVVLANADNEPVHFVIDLYQSCPVCRAHGGWGMRRSTNAGFKGLKHVPRLAFLLDCSRIERPLENLPDFFIFRLVINDSVPVDDSPGIGVYNENGMIPRIKKNRVS